MADFRVGLRSCRNNCLKHVPTSGINSSPKTDRMCMCMYTASRTNSTSSQTISDVIPSCWRDKHGNVRAKQYSAESAAFVENESTASVIHLTRVSKAKHVAFWYHSRDAEAVNTFLEKYSELNDNDPDSIDYIHLPKKQRVLFMHRNGTVIKLTSGTNSLQNMIVGAEKSIAQLEVRYKTWKDFIIDNARHILQSNAPAVMSYGFDDNFIHNAIFERFSTPRHINVEDLIDI